MRDQAMAIQKQLAQEEIEIAEDNIRIVITGDQKLKSLEIDGLTNERVLELINKAIKNPRKPRAQVSGNERRFNRIIKGQGPMGE